MIGVVDGLLEWVTRGQHSTVKRTAVLVVEMIGLEESRKRNMSMIVLDMVLGDGDRRVVADMALIWIVCLRMGMTMVVQGSARRSIHSEHFLFRLVESIQIASDHYLNEVD